MLCHSYIATIDAEIKCSFPLSEINKAVDMYIFLFDDILLLTKVKKAARKVRSLSSTTVCIHDYERQNHLSSKEPPRPVV